MKLILDTMLQFRINTWLGIGSKKKYCLSLCTKEGKAQCTKRNGNGKQGEVNILSSFWSPRSGFAQARLLPGQLPKAM